MIESRSWCVSLRFVLFSLESLSNFLHRKRERVQMSAISGPTYDDADDRKE